MGMFLRVYFANQYRDISLQEYVTLSIGGTQSDTLCVSAADLQEKHIVVYADNNSYKVVCNGAVNLIGTGKVKDAVLQPSQIYILSKKHRISMLVIEEYTNVGTVVDLNAASAITIGRDRENDIVLANPIISGKHAKITKVNNEYYVQDLESMNGTYVNGQCVKSALIENRTEIVIGDIKIVRDGTNLLVYGVSAVETRVKEEKPQAVKKTEGVLFKRSPRLKLEVPTGTIEIQPPPAIGAKPELDKLGMILPMLSTLTISVVMALVMKNPMTLLYTAPMHLISGVMSFRNYKKQTKSFGETEQLRLKKYNDHIEQVIEEIESKREDHISAVLSSDPETRECFRIASSLDRKLWERRPADSDFMFARAGKGTVDFSMQIRTPKNGLSLVDDELAKKPVEIFEKYNQINNLPIICPILKYSTCGVVGDRNESIRLVNNMLAQIATHHCYLDVKFIVITNEAKMNCFDWLSKLPHSHDDDNKNFSYVAKNKEQAGKLFNAIEPALKERLRDAEKEQYGKNPIKIPYYLFVISEPEFLEGETITKYIYRYNGKIGVGAIFLYDTLESLPKECNLIIETSTGQGTLYSKDHASDKQTFFFDNTTQEELERFGDSLKNVYCNELSGDAEITDKITLYELMGVKTAKEIDLDKRWNTSNVMKTLTAPIGVKEKNEKVYLDLHEDAHGSHGLVAGTTGSGKSETLQTYILSVATTYHPYEVGFVIIDFKGGGMANQFEDLPHLIGAITDMDGKEIDRSLLSIKAELDKRKALFAENNVNKIDQYIELYKTGSVDTPLPHLIIVVDEFAELKADQPEFMQELISAARIGRSLGVHLILATQKPAGQVNDQIWSNSNFKLCLKVRDDSDSNEVLKSPLAAKIKKTGRGYLKVGNDEIFDLFQSAYSGAKVTDEAGNKSTELKEIVKHINRYCENKGIKRLPPICLPSLSKRIIYDEKYILENIVETKIPVGIYDNPSCQEQGIAYMDIAQNCFVIGSTQTGKTNLVQNLIRTVASKYTPNELNLYIIDFASMTLRIFDELNHVGGVVTPDEDEKLKNLFKLLNAEMDYRKKRTTEVGVSSYSAYIEGGFKDLPRILVIMENFAVYKELYSEIYDNDFVRLCREGLTYGISVIVTNTATAGFGYKYMSMFGSKIAFYCNDSSEYSSVFERCRMAPNSNPGSSIYNFDGTLLEMQTFLAFEGDKEIERSNAAKQYIAGINAKNAGSFAKKIPCIPNNLTMDYVNKNYNYSADINEYIVGLDYATVDIVSLKTDKMCELSIVGKNQEKNLKIANCLIGKMVENAIDNPLKMYIIDSIERPLKPFEEYGCTEQYTIDYVEIGTIVDDLNDIIEERYDILMEESIEAINDLPLICVVVNNKDAVDYMSSTKDVCEKYKQMMRRAKALKVLFVFSDVFDASVPFSGADILKKQKETKNAFITDNLKEVQFFDIASNVARAAKQLQDGDVFYLNDTSVQRLKLIEE